MTQFKFESEQAAWEYYLNLDSHHFEEKQHNNIYTDAFEAGAEWEHKRLVEKACEWLRAISNFYQGGSNTLPEVICMFDTINEMVDNFKKAIDK